MVTLSELNSVSNDSTVGYIDRIPVRNLWWLLLYASSLLRELGTKDRKTVDDNPDDIPDLVAEILCRRVEFRIKRNLSCGYQAQKAVLGRVRGRIDLLNTERHRLLERGKVACEFYGLTINTVRNRYVRAALDKLSKIVRNKKLAYRCRSLSANLRSMGVTGECPSRREVFADRFGRHDADDQPMVAAAHLAFNLALPTEDAGYKYLSSPDRNIVWIRRLYEKGIAGFYNFVLPKQEWNIKAGKNIDWYIKEKSSGIDEFFPLMRVDIVLDHLVPAGHRIIIDTKFNSVLIKGHYREQTLRSGYIYQIYVYLRSQEGAGDPLADNALGILLHPSIDTAFDEYVVIQNHKIRFCTVDLGVEAKEIRTQLLRVLE
ncbi:MAG: 5-methylcytosine-specific restriction endonuclease system specificity protein McrC [Candidatus Bruticola sp.]